MPHQHGWHPKHMCKRGKFGTELNSLRTGSGWPESEDDFQRVAAHIVQALPHGGTHMLTPHSIDKVVQDILDMVFIATNATISATSLRDHIAPICQLLEPTEFLAKTLVRCDIMEEVMGKELTKL
eukprot:6200604-Karenia_brevis.AAC.1